MDGVVRIVMNILPIHYVRKWNVPSFHVHVCALGGVKL